MLYVFYDLISRENLNDFEAIQINNIVEFINKENLTSKIIEEFSISKEFSYDNEGNYILNNEILNEIEILSIKENHLLLECNNENSKFLNFISLYYPNFIVIDLDNKQMSSLRLVNPLQIS
jgi:hypothetical protein